jgi:hypothetical protein
MFCDANNMTSQKKASALGRYEMAQALPFMLRAWWLRDMEEYADVTLDGEVPLTLTPLWSLHSDPICDAGNLDLSGP